MASINQFLKQLGTGDSIKDYQHAARIFIDDNYRLSPKYGFIFHVAFDLNTEITRVPRDQMLEMGMIVKSANLPKFTVENKVLNAYNRTNVVQNKIKYDPVTITFHDDSADLIRDFWYDYYSYYYRDSDYNETVYAAPHKYDIRQQQSWGYQPRQYPASAPGTQQYIRAIRIYSLHQKRFSEYVLLNPTITSFRHGDHANGANELMQHEMSIQYEAVKYRFGYVSKNTVSGFADLHYDHVPSPLTPAGGGTKSILGPGGLLSSIDEVTNDLSDGNLLAAAFKGYRTLQNAKGMDLKAIAGAELAGIGMGILRGQNPLGGISIPTISNLAGGFSGTRPSDGQYGNNLLAGLFAGGVGVAAGAVSGTRSLAKSATGVIRSNGDKIDVAASEAGTHNPSLPGTNVSYAVDNGDGTATTYYTDGSKTIEDSEGNIISKTNAPSQPPANAEVFDDGSYIQTYDDGSQLIVDADGNATNVPAQDATPPLVYESEQVELSSSDWGEEQTSDQSTPSYTPYDEDW